MLLLPPPYTILNRKSKEKERNYVQDQEYLIFKSDRVYRSSPNFFIFFLKESERESEGKVGTGLE